MSEPLILPNKSSHQANSTLLVVITTLNEFDNLPILVPTVFELFPGSKVLVIDDDSTDGTGEWCDVFKERDPRLEVLHRVGERGLGSATLAGFRWGLENQFDLIATMDADLSHDPKSLKAMLEMLENDQANRLGLVIGSRYVEVGGIRGWPWYRHLASRMANTYVRCILRLKTRDNTSGFRLYRSRALRRIDLSDVASTGYAYLEEILWRLQRVQVESAEIPIVFVDRVQGQSKVRLGVVLNSLFQILKMSIKNFMNQGKG